MLQRIGQKGAGAPERIKRFFFGRRPRFFFAPQKRNGTVKNTVPRRGAKSPIFSANKSYFRGNLFRLISSKYRVRYLRQCTIAVINECYTRFCGKSTADGQISVEYEDLSIAGEHISVKYDSNVTLCVTYCELFYTCVTSDPKILTLGLTLGIILA